MSIAQRYVAGEGDTHPFENESGNVSVSSPAGEDRDAAALHAFATDATNLPWLVFRAAFRAAHVDGLTARGRALLAALARTVDAGRPFGAIFARRDLLNDRSLLSRRTLYRALDDLESAGLIRRAGQLRITSEGYEGQFGRTYLHLTDRAAVLLGFVEPAVPVTTASPSVPQSETRNAAAGAFDPPGASVAPGADIRDLYPASSQKRQPGQVPADLERLRSLGFSKFLIFGLMRDARQHGKRLSDVVEATWTHLKRANRPICYLRSLLRSPVDFGYQLRAKNTETATRRDAEAEREEAARFAIEAAGQIYVNDAGTRRVDVDRDGQGATVWIVGEGTARREAGDWKLRLLRAVRAGGLRVVTTADLEAFAQVNQPAPVFRPVEVAGPRQLTQTVSAHLAGLRALIGGAARSRANQSASTGKENPAAAVVTPAGIA
ncbi:hypothetical protein [Paraburkholderia fungorum]